MMIVAVIDRYPVLRSGLKLLLNDQIADLTIVESQDTASFNKAHPSLAVDLIILDVSRADSVKGANIPAISLVKKRHPSSRFIIYDETPEPAMVLTYLNAGVNGYLSKQAETSELVDCIREVMQGKRYVGQEVLNLVLEAHRSATAAALKSEVLTAREYEIAQYLCEGMGTNWIAATLELKPSTVSTFKAQIFKKLSIDNVIKLKEEMNKRGLIRDCILS